MRVAGTAAALEVQLTDEEAVELAKLAQEGHQPSRDTLTHSLMGLALSIAGTYSRRSRWSVDEAELQGVALETLLRYGIDRYNPDAGIPVRTWAALTIRRKLAGLVERTQKEAETLTEWVQTEDAATEPENLSAVSELQRILTWVEQEGILTPEQVSIMVLRGKGELFGAIGERLNIHRKKASREYAAAMEKLDEAVQRGAL